MSWSSPIDLENPRKRRSTSSDQEEHQAKKIPRFFNYVPVKTEPMQDQVSSLPQSPPWSSHYVDTTPPQEPETRAEVSEEAVRLGQGEHGHDSVSTDEAQDETHVTPDQSDEEGANNNDSDGLGTEWLDELSFTASDHNGDSGGGDAEAASQRLEEDFGVQRHGHCVETAPNLVLRVGPRKESIMVYRTVVSVCCPKLLKSDAQLVHSIAFGIPELLLPHDDAKTIFNLLELLCPSSENVAKLSARETALVAEAAHRYECTRRIQDRVYGTFNEVAQQQSDMRAVSMQDLWDLLIAAYWLGSAAWFERFTSLMLTGKPKSYLELAMQTRQKEVGLRISLALEEIGRATPSNPSSAATGRSGLCLDCFKAAKNSFERRASCQMCDNLELDNALRGTNARSHPLGLVLTQH